MVNRPAGSHRSQKWERSDYDWYVESPRAAEQLFHGIDFGNDLIWDPCCGRGNILDIAKRWGHPTFGSDVVDRKPRHTFQRGNILKNITRMPKLYDRATSVVSNPPYGYEPDIAERIIARILELFAVRRAAFILPIAFLAGQDRWRRDRLARWKPSHVAVYRERHTMPPGHAIDTMANPFDGGMADYCVLVFTRPHRWRTEFLHLEPGHQIPPHAAGVARGATNER